MRSTSSVCFQQIWVEYQISRKLQWFPFSFCFKPNPATMIPGQSTSNIQSLLRKSSTWRQTIIKFSYKNRWNAQVCVTLYTWKQNLWKFQAKPYEKHLENLLMLIILFNLHFYSHISPDRGVAMWKQKHETKLFYRKGLFTFHVLHVRHVMNGIARDSRRRVEDISCSIIVKFYNNYPQETFENCENWKEPLINSFFILSWIGENCSKRKGKCSKIIFSLQILAKSF